MNLFKHFSWAGMLRATYAIVRSNFGARFQRFCYARIGLAEGDIAIPAAGIPRGNATEQPVGGEFLNSEANSFGRRCAQSPA
jgi:hypothetical protein